MVSANKLVQVPMDDELLAELNRLSRAEGSSRSALIRRACREYLRRLREETLDEAYERGYRALPEDAALGQAQASLAARVLAEERW